MKAQDVEDWQLEYLHQRQTQAFKAARETVGNLNQDDINPDTLKSNIALLISTLAAQAEVIALLARSLETRESEKSDAGADQSYSGSDGTGDDDEAGSGGS